MRLSESVQQISRRVTGGRGGDENWCRVGMAGHVAVGDMVLSQRCQYKIRACESRRIRENRDTEAGCVRWRIALLGWGCGCGSVARL